MKAFCVLVVAAAFLYATMAYKEKNEHPEKKANKLKPEVKTRNRECKNEWFYFVCKAFSFFGKCNVTTAMENCAKTCGHCNPCDDIYPKPRCLHFHETDRCHTHEARANCGTTCESCGKACKNYIKECKNQTILDELCSIPSGGFILCPRGCNLCIDRE